jgi:TrmH family RNA methyltransferase
MPDAEHADQWIEHITSPANPTLKLARSLHRRRSRYRERAILVEGARALLTALENGITLQSVLIDHERFDQIEPSLMDRIESSARRVLRVDSKLFNEVADTEQPQPLVAIADLPESRMPEASTLILAVDGVRDPGNLGTLIRSAAAAGADGVALLPRTVDPYNPKVVRASAGTIFAIPVVQFRSPEQIVEAAFTSQPVIAIAEGSGSATYDEFDWTRPTILVIGGEASGSQENTRTYADTVVSIPMHADVESLNAGVAGSILLFEASRQRRSGR